VRIWIQSLVLLLLTRSLSGAQAIHYSATNLWQAAIGPGGQSSPAVGHDGAVYIGTWQGKLLAFNGDDGAKRWAFDAGLEMASSPAVGADETIYIGCRNRKLYAVDKHGKRKWSFKTGGWVDTSAALAADGTVYFGSWDKQFYALNPDGSKKWSFQTGGPIVSSAAIDATGVIYFGSCDKTFYALNPDGSKRWSYTTDGDIISSPAISNKGVLYFTSVDGNLHALNPDGTPRWDLRTGGITGSSPVLGVDGTIYISVNTTHCAVSPDGKFKWIRDLWHPPAGEFGETAAAVLANGRIVFTGGDGFVMTVPPEHGDQEWIWNYWLSASHSSVVVNPQGIIYAAGLGTELHAIINHVPLADSAWPMFRADPQHTGRVRGGR
jgi:outer membrane protein assembly factor BamB